MRSQEHVQKELAAFEPKGLARGGIRGVARGSKMSQGQAGGGLACASQVSLRRGSSGIGQGLQRVRFAIVALGVSVRALRVARSGSRGLPLRRQRQRAALASHRGAQAAEQASLACRG